MTLDQILTTAAELRIVAPIRCADGFTVSVQASNGHYCLDANGRRPVFSKETIALPFTAVEVGYPSAMPEPWRCSAWAEGYDAHDKHPECDGWERYAEDGEGSSVYGFVPVQMVKDLIAVHGGEVVSRSA